MSKFKAGETVYFMHPAHSWVLGSVVSVAKDVYTCKANDGPRKISGDVIEKIKEDGVTNCREDLTDEMVDDLLQLTILHDSTLLRCLHLRYMKDVVYTNIGAIVVALNPFNVRIPHYQDSMMPNYLSEGDIIEKNLPHSWAQAHNTFHEMINDAKDQCVLISGESGAGKTEATKIVMKYLAAISCKRGSDAEKQASTMVGVKLAACSPFLEAFGNAKTGRNDNSSRFGKFMRVKFTASGMLVGAHVTKYLLEKSRIVTASVGERIYHAFYLCVRGKYASLFGMGPEAEYLSINAGKTPHAGCEFDSAADFDDVVKSMEGVGMIEKEIKAIWSTTAAVMSLQNMQFSKKDDGCEIVTSTMGYLNFFIDKLLINGDDVKRELTKTTMESRDGPIVTDMSMMKAVDGRDALCKMLYDGVFSWLVEKCNEKCNVESNGNWVGLLDIFGFEDFPLNSFEQLCINLANETLQNHYNNDIFSKDLAECRGEGIDVTEVKCPDNGPCLTLITGNMAQHGLIAMLDEECSLAKGEDIQFLEKAATAHAKHPFFEKKKLAKSSFIIHHYAAHVSYEVHGWLEKNRDTLKDAMKLVIRQSKDPMVGHFIKDPADQVAKKQTVGGYFKEQVKELMDVINNTNPHWIRCVKPHPQRDGTTGLAWTPKKPLMFDGVTTMQQLESSGVLGTVKVRKAGYPVRITFAKFLARYLVISAVPGTPEQQVAAILSCAGLSDKAVAQIGKTKVYMKSEAYPTLERKRTDSFLLWSLRLQRFGKGYLGRLAVFRLWYEKNKARLAAEKKAREEKERAEKEQIERERAEKENAERVKREAAAAAAAAEMAAKMAVFTKSACVLQKNFRGWYTRRRVYRDIVERERAKMERQVEVQMVVWREKHTITDTRRLNVERCWTNLLRDAEHLQQLKSAEFDRKQKVVNERERIKARQQGYIDTAKKKVEAQHETVAVEMERERALLKASLAAEAARHSQKMEAKASVTKEEVEARKAEQMRREIEGMRAATRGAKKQFKAEGDFITRRQRAWEELAPGAFVAPPRASASPARTTTAEAVASRTSLHERQHFNDMKQWWALQEDWADKREEVLERGMASAARPSPPQAPHNYRMMYPDHMVQGTPTRDTTHDMPSVRDATAMYSPHVAGPRNATTPPSGSRRAHDAAMEANYRRKVDMDYLFSPEKK